MVKTIFGIECIKIIYFQNLFALDGLILLIKAYFILAILNDKSGKNYIFARQEIHILA
jgi:hypothetical protein